MSVIKELITQLHVKTKINFNDDEVSEDLKNSYSVFLKSNSDVEDKRMLERLYSTSIINNAEKIINLETGRIDKKILKIVQADVKREVEKYKIKELKSGEKEELKKDNYTEEKKQLIEYNKRELFKLFEENPDAAKDIAESVFKNMSEGDREKTFFKMFEPLINEIPEAKDFFENISKCLIDDNGIKLDAQKLKEALEKCTENIPKEQLEKITKKIEEYFNVKITNDDSKWKITPINERDSNPNVQDDPEVGREPTVEGTESLTQNPIGANQIQYKDIAEINRRYQLKDNGILNGELIENNRSYNIKPTGEFYKNYAYTVNEFNPDLILSEMVRLVKTSDHRKDEQGSKTATTIVDYEDEPDEIHDEENKDVLHKEIECPDELYHPYKEGADSYYGVDFDYIRQLLERKKEKTSETYSFDLWEESPETLENMYMEKTRNEALRRFSKPMKTSLESVRNVPQSSDTKKNANIPNGLISDTVMQRYNAEYEEKIEISPFLQKPKIESIVFPEGDEGKSNEKDGITPKPLDLNEEKMKTYTVSSISMLEIMHSAEILEKAGKEGVIVEEKSTEKKQQDSTEPQTPESGPGEPDDEVK